MYVAQLGRLFLHCMSLPFDFIFLGIAGKTYTMGSAFAPGGGGRGVIPRVMDTIFTRIESATDTMTTVRAGFVEIHTVCPHLPAMPCLLLGLLDIQLSVLLLI